MCLSGYQEKLTVNETAPLKQLSEILISFK